VVYVAIIFGLLFLQFSGTLTVRQSIGDLRFIGTLVSGEDETSRNITAARVLYRGLEFYFTQQDPLVLSHDESRDVRLTPTRYQIDGRAVEIIFSDESVLRFELTDGDPSELHVVPIPGVQWYDDGRMVVPFEFDDETIIQPSDTGAPETVSVERDGVEYFVSAPPRTLFAHDQQRVLVPLSGTSRMIRYAEVSEEQGNIVEFAFGGGQRTVGEQYYRQTIDAYFEAGYDGWASGRFNGGSGTWDMRDQSARFEEEILVAYLAEAWARGEYTIAFNRMRRAADLHPDDVGILSAPFLGNLRVVTRETYASDRDRTDAMRRRIAAQDATVFRDEDALRFAALRGSETLYRELLAFAETVDFRTVEIPTAVGMLASALDVQLPSADARQSVDRFIAIIEERVFPAIRQFEEFFFLESSPGEIDVWYSIRAGDLLEKQGRATQNQLLITIGRNLVLSGLQLADDRGFLPGALFFNDDGIQGSEGAFGPERLYPFFTDTESYPHMISLYEQIGAGSHVWTISEIPSIEVRSDQIAFAIEIVPDQTQYVIVQGVPPFESMNLFGLQWRNDPTFELYIKGRHYEPDTRTLMIKYTDDDPTGDIVLNY
jgi:hypothetical protein